MAIVEVNHCLEAMFGLHIKQPRLPCLSCGWFLETVPMDQLMWKNWSETQESSQA